MKFILFILILFSSCIKEKEEELLWKEKVRKGDYYFSCKNIDMALKFWIESLEYKKTPLIFEKIVASFIIKNDFENAKKYAKTGLTYFNKNDNLLFNLGLAQFFLGEYDDSLKTMDQLIRQNRYYPDAHYLKGMIYEKKGYSEEAKREYIEELNVNPGSKKAWRKIKEMGK
ncbi:MAG: tetratricopeptide repeat protein [candidate division WOR-3 bacterium]|nr:hypothetical protein [Candidatus Omnitrophota bacterium]